MFKATQPNPDRSNPIRIGIDQGKANPEFKTLNEFSVWLDGQLLVLESSHDNFVTSKSVRKFLKRS